MIVQSAPAGDRHLVIAMAEHTEFAARVARVFGNDRFAPVEPRAEMLDVIGNHDCGWAELDAAPGLDSETGLPYNLTRTPFAEIIKTSTLSPERNEARHAYCGLISSMHSWGLYNGRYGMSDRILLDILSESDRPAAEAMLEGEIERQRRLKTLLAGNPETAGWVEDAHLFQNYKQLQFFDTLALYFHMTGAAERTSTVFSHVPMSADEDTSVALTPLGDGVGDGAYAFDPFPFAEDGVEIVFTGRYLAPLGEPGTGEPREGDAAPDLAAILAAAPRGEETVRFVAH